MQQNHWWRNLVSWVDELKELVPEYAKDIKLNLDAVINRSTVDYDYASALALAAALATGNQDIVSSKSHYDTMGTRRFLRGFI